MRISSGIKLCMMASVFILCIVGLSWLLLPHMVVKAAGSSNTGTAEWDMLGYNAAHTGYNYQENTITQSNVSQLTPGWGVTTNLAGVSSAVWANGIIYIASDKLYALNASTGATVWTFSLPFTVAPTTPAVVNGVVYVDRGSTLYAFNATTGATIWTTTQPSTKAFTTAPTVTGGLIYVGSQDKKLYAFETATGTRHWTALTGGTIDTAPAVANGVVYVGSDKFYAFNAKTGASIWTFTASSAIGTVPSVANGMVYFGTGGSASGATFYALNATTGMQVWSFNETGDTAFFGPGLAVANGLAFIPLMDGHLYAVDAQTGASRWTHYLGNYSLTSPTMAHGVVYIGMFNYNQEQDNVFAFAAGSGKQLWTYPIFEPVSPYSSLTVVNGMVYVGAQGMIQSFHL